MKKFDMAECKIANTPMHPTCNLGKDEECKKVEQKVYKGMTGFLLYLTASKPGIFSVYAYVLDSIKS